MNLNGNLPSQGLLVLFFSQLFYHYFTAYLKGWANVDCTQWKIVFKFLHIFERGV
jgi:hypothetical protein